MSTKDPNMKVIFGSDTKDFDKGAKQVKQGLKDLDKSSQSMLASISGAFGVSAGKVEQVTSAMRGLGAKMTEAGNAGAMTVKKAVRKFTRFYIKPVVEDQNSVNAALVNALRQERNYIQIQEQAVRELKERVAALETEIAELKKNDRAALETEIAELKKNGRAALETEISELKKAGRAALEAEIAAGRPEAESAAGRPEDGEQRTEENSSRNLKKAGRSTGTKPKYFK